MICSYERPCPERKCPDSCTECMRGIGILVGIISGLLFAAAVVLLFMNSLLTEIFSGVLSVLITGIVVLFIVLTAALASGCESRAKSCLKCYTGSLFFGIIGTILSAFLAVSTELAADSVFAIVAVGLTAFFFAYLIIAILFFVLCLTKCRREARDIC